MLRTMVIGLSLATVVAFAPAAGKAEDKTLIFAADEWCPVNCDPGSDRPGYMVEIAREVFEPLGYTIEYRTINWSRALLYTRLGEFDGIFGASRNEATDFVFPQAPQGTYQIGIFSRKGDPWTYEGPASFSGKIVGLVQDYSYGEELDQALLDHGTLSYASGDRPLALNLRKLDAGRIDLLVEDRNSLLHAARGLGLEERIELKRTFEESELFLALSPRKDHSERLASELENGMARLRESGRLAEILGRYGLEVWDEEGT